MGRAVVPDPFLSRPSSSFSSSIFFLDEQFFFSLSRKQWGEGGYAAGCCARGRLV